MLISRPLLGAAITARSFSSKVTSVDEAVKLVKSNSTVLSGGFGVCGIPDTLIKAVSERPDIQQLTCVSNNAGINGLGLDRLVLTGQISKLIMSYIGHSKPLSDGFLQGKVEIELTPQGTIAERIRAAGSGVPAFYTATGGDTWVEHGKMPVKYDSNGNVVKYSEKKETREFNGRKYILEQALPGDIALIKCWKADPLGNLRFRGSTFSFNAVMAQAAKITIVEADEIVEVGDIAPEDVHVPGIHVTKVVQSTEPKHIERLTVKQDQDTTETDSSDPRIVIARRVALELKDGSYANLGTGVPTLVPNFVDPSVHVTFQSENGILGAGPYPTKENADADLVNAGKETITLDKGASLFDSAASFAMIRAGKINVTVLGAMEVSQYGDLANWGVPGNIKGMGGAMDLVSNPFQTRVIIATSHTTKKGEPKIVASCQHPLTGARVASLIVTELAVFDVHPEHGLTLVELQPGATLEEVQAKTGAPFKIAKTATTKL